MKPDIYTMTVPQLKVEERYVRNRLKEIRRLIQKRNRGWLPPEKKVVIP
jgi:hypothetical protein